MRNLGQPIHNSGNCLPEHPFNIGQGINSVLNDIVEQGRCNGNGIETNFRSYDLSYGNGMEDIGFPGFPSLVLMGVHGHIKCGTNQLLVLVRQCLVAYAK